MSSSTLTLTHSLAHDPRTTLEMWLEEAETVARNLCPQHDPTGALTLVATDLVWHEMPVNVVNPVGPPRWPASIPCPPNVGFSGERRRRRSVYLQAGASAIHGVYPG